MSEPYKAIKGLQRLVKVQDFFNIATQALAYDTEAKDAAELQIEVRFAPAPARWGRCRAASTAGEPRGMRLSGNLTFEAYLIHHLRQMLELKSTELEVFSVPFRDLLAYLEPDWCFESQEEEKVMSHL